MYVHQWRLVKRYLVNRLRKGCWFGGYLIYGTCAWPELVLVFLFYLSSILCPKDFFGVASSDSLRWIRSCLTGFLCSLPISFPSGRRKTSSMGNEQITLLVQLLPGWSSWQDQALFKHLPTEFEKCGFQLGEAVQCGLHSVCLVGSASASPAFFLDVRASCLCLW